MIVLVILWLQSGFDKITDYKGNLAWLNGHFSKSFFKNGVPFLLGTLTFFEIITGATALLSLAELWIYHTCTLSFCTCGLSLLSLLCLFTGQRIAKDYAGAASLMGYFIYVLLLFAFTYVVSDYLNNPILSSTDPAP